MELINTSMKKAVRVITFNKFDAHSEPLFKDLNILNLQKSIDFNLGKFMWNIQNKKLPNFLSTEFKIDIITKSNRRINISNKFIPLYRTRYKENFITIKGPQLWRELPKELKDSVSKRNFAKKYFQHLLGL